MLAARPGDAEALAQLEALLVAPDHRLDAALALRKLQQPHLVFAALTRALQGSPADPTLQQQAEEVAVEVDAVDALFEVLADQVEGTTGPTRAAIHLRLASLNELRLSNPTGAIDQLRAATVAAPREVPPLEGLRRLHLQRQEWAALAEVLEKLARLQASRDEQLATWRMAGRVHEDHLRDEESSLACWLRVLDLAADDREGLEAVRGLATALDRPADLARALEGERSAAAGDRRWTLTLQLAQLQASGLNLPSKAVAGATEVLAAVPTHPEARALLRRFVADPSPLGAAAVGALSAAFEATGQLEARLQLLQDRLECAPAGERAMWLATVESLTAKLPTHPTQALLKALKAFEEGTGRLEKLPALLQLAEQADALDELAEAVEAASEASSDANEVAELLRFVARLRERLKQPQAAVLMWTDLLAVRPEDPEGLDHLFKLFRQVGKAQSAAEVGVRRARLVDGPEKIERLLEAAGLFEDGGATEEALDALEESLAVGTDLRALKAVTRLLADDATPQEWKRDSDEAPVRRAELHAYVLDALAQLEPAAQQGKVHLRRGALLKGTEPAAAVVAYLRAIECGAATTDAIGGLQQLLTTSARQAAAQALEPIHRERKETRALAEVIEVQLEAVPAPVARVQRLSEIAALWELASEPRVALSARLRAFALSSGEEKVRTELARLAGTLGAEDELLAAYEDKLDRGLEPHPATLWRRIAELHDARGQREPATQAWEKATQTDPTDLVLLRAYASRARAQADLSRLATVLRRQVEATAEPSRQSELLVELARLAEEQLADAALAAWATERLSAHAPKDRSLLASLQRLYEKCQDTPKWADALARDLQRARESGSSDEAAIALRLAQLKLQTATDEAGAFELLREVLRLQPGNAGAVAGLVQMAGRAGPLQPQAAGLAGPLLEKRGDHLALVGLLTAQISVQADAVERAALWVKISQLQAGALGDPESAFLAAARALREVPHDPALLKRCVQLSEAEGPLPSTALGMNGATAPGMNGSTAPGMNGAATPGMSGSTSGRADSAAGFKDELAALLEELGTRQPEGPARAELFRALAHLQETGGDPDDAIATWGQVQACLPLDAEAQQRLGVLLDQAGRHAQLATLLQHRAENATPTERPAALLALALAREKLGQLDTAADSLLTLFALDQGLEALGALERVLGKLQRHRERAEVLGRLAAAAPDPQSKNDRLLQQAKALIASGELELAVTLLTEVLRGAPREDRAVNALVGLAAEPRVSARVAESLEGVYRDPAHRWQRLAVLEVLVANADAHAERSLRTELASLYEALGEHRQAFVERLRLVRASVEDPLARAEAERVAIAAQLEEELVGAYEDLLERRPSAAVSLALSQTLARLYSGRLASPAQAARMWEEVARLDPLSLEPLQALAELYRAAKNFAALTAVLRRQVPLLAEVPAQLAALNELGRLAEAPLGDWSTAATAYRDVLLRAPSDLKAFGALARMLERLALHPELYEVLKRRLTVAEQSADERADALVRLGQLALGPLKQPDASLGFFEQTLGLRATDAAAVEGLEALLLRAPLLRAPTAAILEKVYRARQDSPRLAEALELQLSTAPAARALGLFEELAVLREALGDPGRAFLARAEVFKATPENLRVRAELERLAETTAHLEELTALYRAQLLTGLPEPLALALWRAVAVLHQRLGQRPRAAEAWEQVARRQPGEEAPLIALCSLYREERDFAQLPRLLRNRAELQPSVEEQISLLLELVDLAELQLKDPPLAIESCRLALSRAPDHRIALAVLEQLLEAHRHFDELARLLEEQMGRAEGRGDETLERTLRVRLARVKHRSLNDDEGALELLRGVLGQQANHPEALAATTELMRAGGPACDSAAALLEPLLEETQAWPALLEVLGARAGLAVGPARAALLHRVADLHQHRLQSPAAALQTLAGLLRESPEEPRALLRCLSLGEIAKADGTLATLLSEVLPKVESNDVKILMLRPLAALHQKLGDPDAALEQWRALLLLLPDDDEALTAAVGLLESSWRWGELVAVLEARLLHAHDDPERISLLSRIGAVRDDSLSDARGAYSAYRRVLELASNDVAALGRLDRLCSQLQLWTEQAEILARRIRLEPHDAVPLRLRLAEVRRARLEDRTGALPLLAEVLQSHPSHPEALAQLEQFLEGEAHFGHASELLLGGYRHFGDVKRLAAFLEWRAPLSTESTRRRALWLELGKLRLEKQQDPELGFLALARAFKETPADAALRAQLIELAALAQCQDALGAVLEEVLPLLEPEGVAQTSLALGALYEGPLKDSQRAADFYRRALGAKAAFTPALAGLDRVLEGLGRWAELLPVLEECLGVAPTREAKVALLLRISAVADERLDQPDRAGSALREVLELEPAHVAAARKLEELYERTAQPERLISILEHLLLHVPQLERQALRLKLARLCSQTNPQRAIELGRALLTDDPLHPGGFALLVGHYERALRHDELGQLLRARRGVTLDPREVASLEFQLGELAYRRLNQPEPAIIHYREVLERARSHAGALTALVEIYAALGPKAALAQALGELAESPEAAAGRRVHLLRRAEVLVELGSRDLALAAARSSLELLPDAAAELQRLRSVFAGYDAFAELAQSLALLVEAQLHAGSSVEGVTSLLELARIHERLNALPQAAAALQRVLSLEPANRTAFDEARTLYARTSQWAPTAGLLQTFLPHLQSAELPVTLDELSELHEEQLNDAPAAFHWACQAVQLDPTPTSRRDRAERLAKSLSKPAELAKLYQQILEGLAFGPTHERLALALAAIQDQALDQVDEAEKTLLGLLAHDVGSKAALDALVQLFARRALHARQAGALELKLEATLDLAARGTLLQGLAQLHETKLKDPRAAALALRRWVELSNSPESAALLAALHRRHQQWPQCLQALQQWVRLALPEERCGIQLQIAQLCEGELKDPEAAIAAYLQALSFEPSSAPGFQALHRLYKKLDRPAELLKAIEQRLTLTTDPTEQVPLLYEAAALWEGKGPGLQADQRLERILKLRPSEERALEGLARLRRAGERWAGLVDVLTRHVEVAQGPLPKALLCGQLGGLLHQQLRDDEGAVRWWKRALESVPEHRPAFSALAHLHQLHGRWLEATRMIEREALLETDAHLRAELLHRSGLLLEDKLRDLAGASTAYQKALAGEPTHLPSLRRLRALYFKDAHWPGFEQTLAQEAEHAPTEADRASAGLELARHLHALGTDNRRAIRWYEHALSNAPEWIEAAQPLTQLLIAASQWPRAAQTLRVLISLFERGGPTHRLALIAHLSKLGDVERELGHSAVSLQTYEQALKLDATEPGALRGRAELYELAGKATEAAQQYELLLKHHEKAMPAVDRAELRVRLTRLFRTLGEKDRAIAMVEKALDADPVQPVALRLAIELSDGASTWDKAALYRQRLAGIAKGEERFALLVELGKIAQDKLLKPKLAITGYAAALELHPDALDVLERIHLAYRSAGQLQEAAKLQATLLAHPLLSEDARHRETLSLAELLGRTMKEEDRAVALLESALDRSPQFVQALQLLEALLVGSKRWKTLDECTRRLIVRLEKVPASAARRAVLWRSLGELRAVRLKDDPGAFEAYSAGARLAPDDAVAQEALGDFAIAHTEHEAEASAAYVRAIPHSEAPARVCGALARIAQKRGDHDSMLLAAGAAAVLGAPGPDEVRMLREFGRVARAPAQLRAPVSESQWQNLLLHPNLRGSLGHLMALIHTHVGAKYAADLGDFKLHPKKHRIELGESKEPALNNLRFIARSLGFESLVLYSPFLAARITGRAERHPDEGVGIRVNPTAPLSLFIGEPLLREADLQQLTAHLAATLALLRPELGMAVLLPPDGLSLLIEAALTFGDPSYVPRGDPKQLKVEQKRLGKALSAEGKTALARLASNLLRTSGRTNIAATYLDAVRHTTSRAALLVAGDFEPVQARVLPMQSSRVQFFIRELVVFAVGGDLHTLRVQTGSQLTAAKRA